MKVKPPKTSDKAYKSVNYIPPPEDSVKCPKCKKMARIFYRNENGRMVARCSNCYYEYRT